MDTALAPSPATLDAFLGRWRDADGSERANYQLAGTLPLRANAAISSRGVQLIGSGFIVTPEQATALGLGRILRLERHIRPYRNGKDLTATPRNVLAIDLFGLSAGQVRDRFPEVYRSLGKGGSHSVLNPRVNPRYRRPATTSD